MSTISIKTKILRFKKFKNELETKDYTSLFFARALFKSTLIIKIIKDLHLVKNVNGVWYWNGGKVTKSMVYAVYKEVSNKAYGYIKKFRDKKQNLVNVKGNQLNIISEIDNNTNPETMNNHDDKPEYDEGDIARMIGGFTEYLGKIHEDLNAFKAELFDFRQTIKDLTNRIVVSESDKLGLSEQISILENKLIKSKVA